MRVAELQAITQQVVEPLEYGLMKEIGFTNFLGPELQLRRSCCGLATAALQGYLLEMHEIDTVRVIVDLPELSPSLQSRHVFLRYGDSVTIDPTYSQFYEYAGVTVADAYEDPAIASLYPEAKIAVFEDENRKDFLVDFAELACRAAVAVYGHPLRTGEGLVGLYTRIWQPEHYRRYKAIRDPSIDHIVNRMKIHECGD